MNLPTKSSLSAFLRSKRAEKVMVATVAVLLVIALLLPPASLIRRIFHLNEPLVAPDKGGLVPGPFGAELAIPPQVVEAPARIVLEAVTANGDQVVASQAGDAFSAAVAGASLPELGASDGEQAALDALPDDIAVHGPLYRINVRGDAPAGGTLSVPIPYELQDLARADLYGWDGNQWRWFPSRVEEAGTTLSADLDSLPNLIALAETLPRTPSVALVVNLENVERLSDDTEASSITLQGLSLQDDGSPPASAPEVALDSSAPLFLSVSNVVDGVLRNDLTDNMLISRAARSAHVDGLLALLEGGENQFDGLEIAYSGVDPALRGDFVTFISDLATALDEAGYQLAVSIDAPIQDGTSWDSGAYDLTPIGKVADAVRVPVLISAEAYATGGGMDDWLAWVTDRVSRRKIDLTFTTYGHDTWDDQVVPISYKEALNQMAQQIRVDNPAPLLMPGESVSFDVPEEGSVKLEKDAASGLYSYIYEDDQGIRHTVLLETGYSAGRKLQYVEKHALGGAAVRDALSPDNDDGIVQVAQTFQEELIPVEPSFSLVWSIKDKSGNTVQREIVSLDDPSFSWEAPEEPGDYVIGASVSDDEGQSDLGAATELDVEVPTPTFTPTPTNTPTPEPTATPTPEPTAEPEEAEAQAAVARQPSVGGYFGYGIQAAMVTDRDHGRILQHVQGMGFNWVKQQVEWFRYDPAPGIGDENWEALDAIVNSCEAAGVNVLFSVVKAPDWACSSHHGPPDDPQVFAEFMQAMASRYKGRVKAYEIWNEQNLGREWGHQQPNAGQYVELLKASYTAIKSVDPGAVVVAGALTPTGLTGQTPDGEWAVDDRAFLEQLYQAGMGSYCDAVGVHPSGFNNPPDADWRTWQDDSAPSFKGHPSMFFRGTMESYRNIMVKYGDAGKRLWPTEFGWSTFEGLSGDPPGGYEYAAHNTEQEQAQWLVRAFEMSKSWGWVGPMFVWNLNFAPVAGESDEKAGFGIVRGDWSPRPAYSALADMPK